ncbi:MAG TPA: hypothetical protein VFM25_11640 [Verrucomicrobiae bacterium]|nr:hypothetical protein [Verrucomicrobiae bacterium]
MSASIPLSVPNDLLEAIRDAAEETHLSEADVMRQSMKLGLPKLREQFSMEHLVAESWGKLGPAPEIDYDKL